MKVSGKIRFLSVFASCRIIFSAIFSEIYGIKNSKNVYLVEQAEKISCFIKDRK